MTKTTELAIRAKAAIRYPGWRLDIVGPTTAVLTNMMGRRRILIVRRRRNRRDGPWMRLAKRAVPMVIWGVGMWMVSIVIMMMAMGVEL